MAQRTDPRLVNLVGAWTLGMADAIKDATEAAAGMTGAAPAALVALREFLGGRTTEDLAQAVGITHSGAVRLINRLVEAGLVERRPGPDGRSGSIVLTARGRALANRLLLIKSIWRMGVTSAYWKMVRACVFLEHSPIGRPTTINRRGPT